MFVHSIVSTALLSTPFTARFRLHPRLSFRLLLSRPLQLIRLRLCPRVCLCLRLGSLLGLRRLLHSHVVRPSLPSGHARFELFASFLFCSRFAFGSFDAIPDASLLPSRSAGAALDGTLLPSRPCATSNPTQQPRQAFAAFHVGLQPKGADSRDGGRNGTCPKKRRGASQRRSSAYKRARKMGGWVFEPK
eukprot:scaffold25770_cov67-Phaeocystis_antarctica.AAC.6